jgi:hypothetical protein
MYKKSVHEYRVLSAGIAATTEPISSKNREHCLEGPSLTANSREFDANSRNSMRIRGIRREFREFVVGRLGPWCGGFEVPVRFAERSFIGTSNPKPRWNHKIGSAPLIPKLA